MKSVLKAPNYSSKYGHNGFDLSHFFRFSCAPSELLPVISDELYPNDKVRISCDSSEVLTIIAMNSGSFARAIGHIDYFFVPMKQLFAPFESFIYGVDDIRSSVFDMDREQDDYAKYSGSLPFFNAKQLQTRYLGYFDNNSTNQYGVRYTDITQRLLAHLRYGMPFAGSEPPRTPEWPANKILNPFRLAAYQKIFYDYYRLTDWTENHTYAYNLDVFAGSSYLRAPQITDKVLGELLTLHYRPWAKDFFTNIFPEPLFGSQSVNALEDSFDLNQINNWLASDANHLQITDSEYNTDSQPYTTVYNQENFTTPVDVNLSFAVQKLLEKTRRSPKHYDQQTLAHYGIKPARQRDGSVFFLGSHEFNIDVKDVVSTAETADAAIGAIGGRAYGASGPQRPIDFTADTHGILMAIFSIEPYADYAVLGLDKQNSYHSRFDYFIPELDNMGMVPIFRYQAKFEPGDSSGQSQILGWSYAFAESKMKYDAVAGNLLYSARSWMPNRSHDAWTQSEWGENKLYIDPSYFDDLFQIKYLQQDRPIGEFVTDPFEVSLHFDYKKLSVMSTYSLMDL